MSRRAPRPSRMACVPHLPRTLPGHGMALAHPVAALWGLVLAVLTLLTLLAVMAIPAALLIVPAAPRPATVIVPLAGDDRRVLAAVDAQQQQPQAWLLLTNMYIPQAPTPDAHVTRVLRLAEDNAADAERTFTLTEPVRTTYQELQAVKRFAQQRGWSSVLIITSPSHTRRTGLLVREVFADTGVQVQVVPVPGHPYTPWTWWRSKEGIAETVLEYAKLMVLPFGVR